MRELATASEAVDAIVERVGKTICVGTPLGAGKPNHILNALYRRAKEDPAIDLTIVSALTLEKPKGHSDLECRFLEPFVERVFGDYPDLDYELDRAQQALPANVRVMEFYFPPGKFAHNPDAQRNYISSNYTHAARDILARGVNVITSQVTEQTVEGKRRLSLSCNPDVAVDLMYDLRRMEAAGFPVAIVAQLNRNLPFMYGDAEVDPEAFDVLVDCPEEEYRVFGPPKMAVTAADHAIGINISALVKDGGELQVGIGSIGDAVVHALRLRHGDNETYRRVVEDLGIVDGFGAEIAAMGDLGIFERGLFSASEMLVDGFLQLFNDGIIKRKVYDDVSIQRLLNLERITETITPATLDELLQMGAIHESLTDEDVQYLRYFGVFQPGIRLDDGVIHCPDGFRAAADLGDPMGRAALCEHALGTELRHGAVMHAGFFLGPQSFYAGLCDLPEDRRRLIRMRSVKRINQLYGHEEVDRLHRVDGRFINTAMMMTAFGAAVSDALEDGTVISGVGGQYNFVAMAHELPGGRSIINLRSTRTHNGQVVSNIVLKYGHVTIPRHLRDVVVTEYGIASLRGRTDEEVVQALLKITDSRFQERLKGEAQAAGKLSPDYQIPFRYRSNLPERYEAVLTRYGEHFPRFPLGCDFTEDELAIGAALKFLKASASTPISKLSTVLRALTHPVRSEHEPYLERMGFADPHTFSERLGRKLLSYGLERT